jgi:hypothetical protein
MTAVCTEVLARLQRGLETLYRVDTQLDVEDFVIDEATRDTLVGATRTPREQLLVSEIDGELGLALFVHREALATLERHDPADGLHQANLHEFLLTLEGVSHFVYLVWRARAAHRVSALELELQAEVDKYVTCVLTLAELGETASHLPSTLFRAIELADDLDDDERTRYRVANENALRYSESLDRRFVGPRRLAGLLAEVRQFYRMPLEAKLRWIRSGA